MQRQNFGGNRQLNPNTSYLPATEQEVLEILDRHHGQRIRCIGRLHSWSRAVECNDVLLDLRLLNQVNPVPDSEALVVTVGAGCQIKHLLSDLERLKNWALPSLGLITEQTVAGAVSTGTHGSGRNSLSQYVVSVRIAHYDSATGKATVTEISSGDALRAARCSLGCLGVILSVKMLCRPSYNVEEAWHEHEQLADVIDAEREYPLQQFFLVPWRWTYMSQYRRETDHPESRTSWLYHWYRYLTIDIGESSVICSLTSFAHCTRSSRSSRNSANRMILMGIFRMTGRANFSRLNVRIRKNFGNGGSGVDIQADWQ